MFSYVWSAYLIVPGTILIESINQIQRGACCLLSRNFVLPTLVITGWSKTKVAEWKTEFSGTCNNFPINFPTKGSNIGLFSPTFSTPAYNFDLQIIIHTHPTSVNQHLSLIRHPLKRKTANLFCQPSETFLDVNT